MTLKILIFSLAVTAFVVSAIALSAMRAVNYSNTELQSGLWIGVFVSITLAVYYAP